MSASNIIIIILIIVVLFLALWVRSLEKTLDIIESTVLTLMTWHEKQVKINERTMKWFEKQGKINDRLLQWCKNTDKTLDNMLETQAKLTELGNETYTKYLEVQAQIYGIKFELDQKDLVAEYCANDALATEAVLIDGEEEE